MHVYTIDTCVYTRNILFYVFNTYNYGKHRTHLHTTNNHMHMHMHIYPQNFTRIHGMYMYERVDLTGVAHTHTRTHARTYTHTKTTAWSGCGRRRVRQTQ